MKQDDKEKNQEPDLSRKTYSFDHSKTFFRNLTEMIRFSKYQKSQDDLKE